MSLENELKQAYLATDYCLWLAGQQYTLHIDEPAEQILELLTSKYGIRRCAYIITPCNPRSEPLDSDANRKRLKQFREQLQRAQIRWLPAVNRDPNGQWPDEPGALLIDCEPDSAHTIAEHFEQNAMVRLMVGKPPSLVILSAWRHMYV